MKKKKEEKAKTKTRLKGNDAKRLKRKFGGR